MDGSEIDDQRSDDEPWIVARPGGVGVMTSWRSHDGQILIASSGTDGVIRLWDAMSGTSIGTPLLGHTAAVWALTKWTDQQGRSFLASAGEDASIRIWDVQTGAAFGDPITGHTGWVPSLTSWIAGDGGARLASAGNDGKVHIWNVELRQSIAGSRPGPGGPLWAITTWMAPGGKRLVATGGDQGLVCIWDVDTGEVIGEPLICPSGVRVLHSWTNGIGQSRLAAGLTDGVIFVWAPDSVERAGQPLLGHRGAVGALTDWPTSMGMRMASAAADGTVRIWDMETSQSIGAPLGTRPGYQPAVTSWLTDNGHAFMASVGDSGAIRVWDVETREQIGGPVVGHTAALWALTSWTERDGSVRLALGGDDAAVRIWNADNGLQMGESLLGHTAPIWSLLNWESADGHTVVASTGDDGTIRLWDLASGDLLCEPLVGHSGWVPALSQWIGSEGRSKIASAGVDGTVRIWDASTGAALGPPRTSHPDWVLALISWRGSDGRVWMATAGHDRTIRLWDADTGAPIGAPLRGHTDGVRALTSWVSIDGAIRLASSGYDGTVRIWDPEQGVAIGTPLEDHGAVVASLISWIGSDGRPRLASGGDDHTIRLWDADTGLLIGDPLIGHDAGVWALTSWSTPDGRTRLASTGYDGSVRLWDAEDGRPLRTIAIGAVAIWSLPDVPTHEDLLGRDLLATAIADQLFQPKGDRGAGPVVVGVEGPWGSGKTTLMELVQRALPEPRPRSSTQRKRITVRDALRQLGRAEGSPTRVSKASSDPMETVTAWFNPWAHESGEQVWAGLAQEIINSAAMVLHPVESERERYWFTRNLRRIDQYVLRRLLLRRVVSPILRMGVVALIASLGIALAEINGHLTLFGRDLTFASLALLIVLLMLIAGLVHTAYRYWRGLLAHYVPGELLHRPVSEGLAVGESDGQIDSVVDPMRRARAGSLYLHQHDIDELLMDLNSAGYRMVIFIDDLDRCRATTIAEVFEAINLLLSGLVTHRGSFSSFVIGLDPDVVADRLGSCFATADGNADGSDSKTSLGWDFLRKLVQLPVRVPYVSDAAVEAFVDAATGVRSSSLESETSPNATVVSARPPRSVSMKAIHPKAVHPPVEEAAKVVEQSQVRPTNRTLTGRLRTTTLAWRSLEQHPQVRDLIIERMKAQPDRSTREAKRLLNVWQLYERVVTAQERASDPEKVISRARNLVLLAEILTRWPALQCRLHQSFDGQRGLQILAGSAQNEQRWQRTVARLWPEQSVSNLDVAALRQLLREYDGLAVAELAATLL